MSIVMCGVGGGEDGSQEGDLMLNDWMLRYVNVGIGIGIGIGIDTEIAAVRAGCGRGGGGMGDASCCLTHGACLLAFFYMLVRDKV